MAYAALVTWVVTAGFGFFMFATWLRSGGARPQAGTASHFQPPVVFTHFLLAAGGLVLWIVYVINDKTALAWVAFVDLLVVGGLGDLLVLRWFKDRRATTGSPTGGGPISGESDATSSVQLAEQRIPKVAVVVHGIFAVTTVVLVLLAALEVGGS